MMLVAGVAVVVLALDQITKFVALEQLPPGSPVPVVDGFLALTLVLNPGLAFGIFSATSPRWLAAVLSLGALSVLVFFSLRLLAHGSGFSGLALGLIFGGAVGNLIDRGRFGAVVDFIDVSWRGFHWPAFNLADSAITIGVGLLAIRLMTSSRSS